MKSGCAPPLVFDLQRARQEERRSRLAKAFSRLFRRHRSPHNQSMADDGPIKMQQQEKKHDIEDIPEVIEEEEQENWTEIPLYSLENISTSINNDTTNKSSSLASSTSTKSKSSSHRKKGGGGGGDFKGQLEEFGRSFRRLFGIDTVKGPKPIQETIPLIKPIVNDHHEAANDNHEESIDLMPIEKRQSISKAAEDFLQQEKLQLFSTLSSPEAWKTDQQLMASGNYTKFPEGFCEKYQLLCLIGEGSFGFVWEAKRVDVGDLVAIKFAHRQRISEEDSNWILDSGKRVLREVALLKGLEHPSIIRLIESWETEDYVMIVTERFGTPWTWPNPKLSHHRNEGLRPVSQLLAMNDIRSNGDDPVKHQTPSDLFECIESHYYLPERTIYKIFSQLLDVVLYLRERGLLHRDLKDENILVDEAYRIKLIDFGSAAPIPLVPASSDDAEDYFKQFNGTLAFSAPEIVKGLWYKGSLAEVWTLGILLYTLRWRRSPFPDSRAILEEEPSELGEGRATDGVGDRLLKEMLRRMLEKKPSRRIPLGEIANQPWLKHCQKLYKSPSPLPL